MSPLLISLAGLALFAAGICALPYVYAAWRRLYKRGDDLQMWHVLRRRGIAAEELPGNSLARALRRCTFCADIERCERWLVSPEADDLADFCPNATLFARVARDKATKP